MHGMIATMLIREVASSFGTVRFASLWVRALGMARD